MNKGKVVCIGDSLTEGYGVLENERWSNLVADQSEIEIINSGISGDTSAGMLSRFNEMVIKLNPTHVIITGGTNDLTLNIPDNQIIANILAMTRYARHHEIQSIIGIPTPIYNLESFTEESLFITNEQLLKRIKTFQENLFRFALDDEQPILDFRINMGPEYFTTDGIHPDNNGHICMAKNAIELLESI